MSKIRINVIMSILLMLIILPINAVASGDFEIVAGVLVRYNHLAQGGDVVIPEGVTEIGDSAFSARSNLYSVSIPNSVTKIGDGAFFDCPNLTAITIPDSVTTIDHVAFAYSGLSSITIPESVTSIGYRAFANCKNLESIEVDTRNEYYSSENGLLLNQDGDTLIQVPAGMKTQKFLIPEGIKTIVDSAFEGIVFIEVIEIPSSVEQVYAGSFWSSYSLKEIDVNQYNELYKSIDGVLFTKDGKTLIKYPIRHVDTNYTIPYGTEVIGPQSFELTKSLQTVVLPNTVRIIEPNAFAVSSLEGIYIPEGLEEIEGAAFYNCRQLGDTYIPSTVNRIDNSAFADCMRGNINFSISGIQDSYAEDYAKRNGIRFNQVSGPDNLWNFLSRFKAVDLDEHASEVFLLTNSERKKAGLPQFEQIPSLTKAARIRANELAIQYSHNRLDGQAFHTVYDEHGVEYRSGGENIAMGQKTPYEVVNDWMNSPGHRTNILNPNFRNLGVGVAIDADGQVYWSQNFTD